MYNYFKTTKVLNKLDKSPHGDPRCVCIRNAIRLAIQMAYQKRLLN